jgi:SSS family solute:Na+ symporter
MLLLVFFAGFTALEVVPGLKGPQADQSFLIVVQKFYPSWVLGFICAAGALAGLVPASVQVLAAASIVAKNVFADNGLVRGASAQTRLTRVLVLVVALLAFGFWALAKATIVGLLLIGYNGITQLFPGVILALREHRPPAVAVGAGIVAGLIVLVWFTIAGQSVVSGINTGFIALAVNVIVLGIVAAVAPKRAAAPARA